MARTLVCRVVFFGGLLGGASACGGEHTGRHSDDSPVTGTSREALVGGVIETQTMPDSFPSLQRRNAVVEFGTGSCSGFLVTPELIITAAHCVKGVTSSVTPDIGPNTQVTVGFSATDPNQVTPRPTVTRVVGVTSNNIDNSEHQPDAALLQISPAVFDKAFPAKPKFGSNATGLTTIFEASWGPLSYSGNPVDDNTSGISNVRSIFDAGGTIGHVADTDPDRSEFTRSFCNAVDDPSSYPGGLLRGDSGSALYSFGVSNGQELKLELLGIAAHVESTIPSTECGFNHLIEDHWTDVTIRNDKFTPAAILNLWESATDGNFTVTPQASGLPLVEFGGFIGQRDYDGPCRREDDPDCDRFFGAVDTDLDGVADFKDNCPMTANPNQENCNVIQERDGLTLRTDTDGTAPRVEIGDACDPMPCVEARTGSETLVAPFASGPCSGSTATPSCPIRTRTTLTWEAKAGLDSTVAGKEGTFSFLHCDCPQPHSTVDEIRSNCRRTFQDTLCVLGEQLLDNVTPLGQWRAITTQEQERWSPFFTSNEFTLDPSLDGQLREHTARLFGNVNVHLSFLENPPIQKTRWLFWQDAPTLAPGIPLPTTLTAPEQLQPLADAMNGIGATVLRDIEGETTFPGHDPTQDKQDVGANIFPQDIGQGPQVPLAAAAAGGLVPVFPLCGLPLSAQPWGRVTSSDVHILARGHERVFNLDPSCFSDFLRGVYSDNSGRFAHMAAAEPLPFLAAHGVSARTVFLDRTASVPAVVAHEWIGKALESVSDIPFSDAIVDASDYSAVNEEIYQITRKDGVRVLDIFGLHQPDITEFPVPFGGDNLFSTVALTYRYVDDALYALDVGSAQGQTAIILSRVTREGAQTPLGAATFAGTAPTKFYLDTAYDGALFLVGSGSFTDRPFYARIDVSGSSATVISVEYDTQPGQLVVGPDATDPFVYQIVKKTSPTAPLSVEELSPGDFVKVNRPFADLGTLGSLSGACEDLGGLAQGPWPGKGRCVGHGGSTPFTGSTVATEKWRVHAEDVRSAPAVDIDGTIYWGADDHKLHATRPDGTEKWAVSTSGDVESSPAIGANGMVYFGSDDDLLRAVTPDGTVLKTFDTGASIKSSPTIGRDGTVYVGSNSKKVYALTPNLSLVRTWTTNGQVWSSPAIGPNGWVYVGSDDKKIYALDPTQSTPRWTFSTNLNVRSSPAVAANGTVYIGSDDGRLYALDGTTGVKKWSFNTVLFVRGSPAIAPDGTIYVGSDDNRLHAIRDNGTSATELWSFNTLGDVRSTPAVDAVGNIYFGSNDGKIRAVTKTGSLLWQLSTPLFIGSSPAIGADGTVYVGSDDDYLRAIGP